MCNSITHTYLPYAAVYCDFSTHIHFESMHTEGGPEFMAQILRVGTGRYNNHL